MILYLHTTFNTILIRLCVLNKNGLVQSILIQLTKRFMEKKKVKTVKVLVTQSCPTL